MFRGSSRWLRLLKLLLSVCMKLQHFTQCSTGLRWENLSFSTRCFLFMYVMQLQLTASLIGFSGGQISPIGLWHHTMYDTRFTGNWRCITETPGSEAQWWVPNNKLVFFHITVDLMLYRIWLEIWRISPDFELLKCRSNQGWPFLCWRNGMYGEYFFIHLY